MTAGAAGLLPLPWAPIATCAALGVCLVESWPSVPQLDDAYISYRYAANLLEGHGLVFNPGE